MYKSLQQNLWIKDESSWIFNRLPDNTSENYSDVYNNMKNINWEMVVSRDYAKWIKDNRWVDELAKFLQFADSKKMKVEGDIPETTFSEHVGKSFMQILKDNTIWDSYDTFSKNLARRESETFAISEWDSFNKFASKVKWLGLTALDAWVWTINALWNTVVNAISWIDTITGSNWKEVIKNIGENQTFKDLMNTPEVQKALSTEEDYKKFKKEHPDLWTILDTWMASLDFFWAKWIKKVLWWASDLAKWAWKVEKVASVLDEWVRSKIEAFWLKVDKNFDIKDIEKVTSILDDSEWNALIKINSKTAKNPETLISNIDDKISEIWDVIRASISNDNISVNKFFDYKTNDLWNFAKKTDKLSHEFNPLVRLKNFAQEYANSINDTWKYFWINYIKDFWKKMDKWTLTKLDVHEFITKSNTSFKDNIYNAQNTWVKTTVNATALDNTIRSVNDLFKDSLNEKELLWYTDASKKLESLMILKNWMKNLEQKYWKTFDKVPLIERLQGVIWAWVRWWIATWTISWLATAWLWAVVWAWLWFWWAAISSLVNSWTKWVEATYKSLNRVIKKWSKKTPIKNTLKNAAALWASNALINTASIDQSTIDKAKQYYSNQWQSQVNNNIPAYDANKVAEMAKLIN